MNQPLKICDSSSIKDTAFDLPPEAKLKEQERGGGTVRKAVEAPWNAIEAHPLTRVDPEVSEELRETPKKALFQLVSPHRRDDAASHPIGFDPCSLKNMDDESGRRPTNPSSDPSVRGTSTPHTAQASYPVAAIHCDCLPIL
ncbi:hypothetical protein TcWFU_006624 [Taenia crassiceps]|uniref:Prolactin receptor n=1 Tax=Taenia crassiceps TaxID=6207 RepID=A0ABR4Q888_9CEST